MAIHHKAPEQHYTTLMAHSGLPYDINPPPHSTDFICKVVGGDKLFFFLFFFHRVLTDVASVLRTPLLAHHNKKTKNTNAQPRTHAVYACPAAHLGLQHAQVHAYKQRHKK